MYGQVLLQVQELSNFALVLSGCGCACRSLVSIFGYGQIQSPVLFLPFRKGSWSCSLAVKGDSLLCTVLTCAGRAWESTWVLCLEQVVPRCIYAVRWIDGK